MSDRKQVYWSYRDRTIVLGPGVDWADAMVRVEVRLDARTLSSTLGYPIAIADACGATLDTVEVPS